MVNVYRTCLFMKHRQVCIIQFLEIKPLYRQEFFGAVAALIPMTTLQLISNVRQAFVDRQP